MNTMALIALVPLGIAGVVYLASAVGYQFVLDRPGMAVTMTCYAISCGGLIYDALTTTVK